MIRYFEFNVFVKENLNNRTSNRELSSIIIVYKICIDREYL